jgi:hypothetical protein
VIEHLRRLHETFGFLETWEDRHVDVVGSYSDVEEWKNWFHLRSLSAMGDATVLNRRDR